MMPTETVRGKAALDIAIARDNLLALPAETLEAPFQLAVIAYAEACGWLVHAERPARSAKGWRTAVQGSPGFPDLVLVRGKMLWFMELKSARGTLSAEQRVWLDAVPCWAVYRPRDSEQIVEVLR